jgi:CheY-like chemotaxis protein
VVADGVVALDYLYRRGDHAGATRPDLVLLDLNLPRKDGREVLEEIKSDPRLRSIPVVVLTTSRAEEDVLRSYDLHANCYITKPVDLGQFLAVVRAIDDFWLAVVRLPPTGK